MKFDGMPGFGRLFPRRPTFTFETGLGDGLHYAEYASYETRLMSFRKNGEIDSWYSSEDFAKAGLFRTGEADECACFQCGNLICGWEYEDDPFEQHAKCSLNCPFVERERTKKKMRMAEASVGDELRKCADFFHAGLSEIWQNGRVMIGDASAQNRSSLKSIIPTESSNQDYGFCIADYFEDWRINHNGMRKKNDNLDSQIKTFGKRQTDTSPGHVIYSAQEESEFYYDDVQKDSLLLQMRVKDFRYRTNLTDLRWSPGWSVIEGVPLQNRGSLKPVIQTENMCQLDEYYRDECFEVLFTGQKDMQMKSENLDGQNENVRKGQTDTSPRNADTGSAPEERDVQDEDVDEEIRALEQLLMCKVCLDNDSCIVFFPCRHMATCESCEQFLQRCPVCRASIDEAVKINEE